MDKNFILLLVIIFLLIFRPVLKVIFCLLKPKKTGQKRTFHSCIAERFEEDNSGNQREPVKQSTNNSENAKKSNLEMQLLRKENENQMLFNQKEELEIKLQTINASLTEMKKVAVSHIRELEETKKELNDILSFARKADSLKDYAGKVYDCLDYYETILIDIGKDAKMADTETASILFSLLHHAMQKTTEISKWKHICSDIQDTGMVIQSKTLKNCFQSDEEAEHKKNFKIQCISKLKGFTNAVLILCKAIGHLSRFVEKGDVSYIESEYKNIFTTIKSKAKEVGIPEIADVELFSPLGNQEAIPDEVSFPYSAVKNLNKEDIVEIVSFGMKTELDEEISKSKVLIN